MKKIILSFAILSLLAGCSIHTDSSSSGKDTSYTFDSLNPRK